MTTNTKHNTASETSAGAAPARSPAGEALAVSELRYRRLFETAKDGILILDASTGMVVDVNPYLVELVGYSRAQFLEKAVWDLGFFKDAIASHNKFRELQKREYTRYENLPLETSDGRRLEVEFVSNVYLVNRKKVIQCNIRNITERKRAEERQELTKRVLQILNRDSDIGGLVHDILDLIRTQARIEAVSIRLRQGDDIPVCEAIGYSEAFRKVVCPLCTAEATGKITQITTDTPDLECMCGNVLCGRINPSKPFFTPYGSFWTNSTTAFFESRPKQDHTDLSRGLYKNAGYESMAIIPLRFGSNIIGVLQLHDHRKGIFSPDIISFFEEIAASIGIALTRQRAMEALQDSEERYRALFFESHDAIMIISPEQGFIAGNPAAIKMFGCLNEQDFINRSLASMSPIFQAGNLPSTSTIHDLMALALEKGSHFFEWTHRRADGSQFPATVLLSRLKHGGTQHLQATVRDITEQRRLETQLRQSQKMEAVGRLAGGVAHDFNNTLTGIMGCTELCRDQIAPDHPNREWLDEITCAAQRSSATTRQLLAFARKQAIEPKILDFNDTLSGMLKMLRRLIEENIGLVWLPGSDIWPVMLDPSQVYQIIANLCLNARDAIADDGTITMQTRNIIIKPEFCLNNADASPGNYVLLSVTDDGGGIDAEALVHIFEPFFTTKEIGKGTGLGLATVYGIVTQNHGFIQVNSTPASGTTFHIYLPRAPAIPQATAVNAVAKRPRGHGETILLVEDDELVRMMTKHALEVLGYRALMVESPEEALITFERNKETIPLLLTDVIMPGMDGQQLAKRLQSVKPEIKVLFMSGYTADLLIKDGALKINTAFIAKPFTRDELAHKLHDLLTGGR